MRAEKQITRYGWQPRKGTTWKTDEREMTERLEAATTLLERALSWLEERQSALTGEVEKISATVEQSRREAELAEKLAAAEREVAELKAAGSAECF